MIFFKVFLSSLISLNLYSATLLIELNEIPKLEGKAFIAIYDSEASYDEEKNPFFSMECGAKIFKEKKCNFKNIPKTTYSLALFWDTNNNKKLDTNFIGYPSEPFGFSNNPTILTGKPGFNRTKFELSNDSETLLIELK